MTGLTIKNLSKAYKQEVVFQDFSLKIPSGTLTAVLGPSGTGKSTLIRMIAGLETWEQGEIHFEKPREDTEIFMIFQSFQQLFPWMTVLQNTQYPLSKRQGKGAATEAIAREALEMAQYRGDTQKYPHQLSGGMKQKVALARALTTRPDILLMDEPFASLDAMTREDMQQLLTHIRSRYPMTILFVTHDIQEAVNIADNILLLGGEIELVDGAGNDKEELIAYCKDHLHRSMKDKETNQ